MMRRLEICAGDLESVMAAAEGGADRIELCSALSEGGLTPSAGMIAEARRIAPGLKLHVLIRPREGDFVYSAEETACMVADIGAARLCGADGVVIGVLTPDDEIDMAACRRLMSAAAGMSVTFHRAFDRVKDPVKALEQVIELGCDRILTSGQASSAKEGVEMLSLLNEQAAGRIILLAGAGVNPDNAQEIMRLGGVNELHASARGLKETGQAAPTVKMGSNDGAPRMVTKASIVEKLIKIIKNDEKDSKLHD